MARKRCEMVNWNPEMIWMIDGGGGGGTFKVPT